MLSNFAQVLVLSIVGVLFVFGALFAGRFVRPKNPGAVKSETYECGEVAKGSAWVNFNLRFYILALVFVVFDVEVALIFPVAVAYKGWITLGSGALALIEILIFVLVLVVGLAYAWAKKDLDWIKDR